MPSLAHLLRASASHGAPFDARAACAIASQICAQLEVPHGAVAPSAIRVEWDGSVALERSGHAPGSALPYMAPERLAGVAPDARSDVYALAMVLLELITGRPARPAPGLTFAGDFPVELIELLDRSSLPDPDRRHSSPREMGAWLALAEEESGGAMSREELAGWLVARFGGDEPPVTRPVSVVAGRRWRLAAGAALLALIGAGAAVIARPLVDASTDRAAAAAMPVDAPAGTSSMSAPSAMHPAMSAPTSEPMAPAATSSTMAAPSTGATAGPSTGSMAAGPGTGSMAAGPGGAERPVRADSALPVGSPDAADAMSGSDAASEQTRKARRRRSRAARKEMAARQEIATSATAEAEVAPAAAPPASCPVSLAPSNTMNPVASDEMAPVSRSRPTTSSSPSPAAAK